MHITVSQLMVGLYDSRYPTATAFPLTVVSLENLRKGYADIVEGQSYRNMPDNADITTVNVYLQALSQQTTIVEVLRGLQQLLLDGHTLNPTDWVDVSWCAPSVSVSGDPHNLNEPPSSYGHLAVTTIPAPFPGACPDQPPTGTKSPWIAAIPPSCSIPVYPTTGIHFSMNISGFLFNLPGMAYAFNVGSGWFGGNGLLCDPTGAIPANSNLLAEGYSTIPWSNIIALRDSMASALQNTYPTFLAWPDKVAGSADNFYANLCLQLVQAILNAGAAAGLPACPGGVATFTVTPPDLDLGPVLQYTAPNITCVSFSPQNTKVATVLLQAPAANTSNITSFNSVDVNKHDMGSLPKNAVKLGNND